MKIKIGITVSASVVLIFLIASYLNSQAIVIPGITNTIFQEPRKNDTGPHTTEPLTSSSTHAPEPDFSSGTTWDDFYSFIDVMTTCTKQHKVGGEKDNPKNDGSKMVCLDKGYEIRPGSCTVLSFGINNEWSFDDAMEELGCKVYAFDPSMRTGDHLRMDNIHFFKLGISDSLKTINGNVGGKKRPWKLDSYRGILNKINETDTIIDYLKIDVEGAEMDFFDNVLYEDAALLKNVKQIGMEIHPGKLPGRRDRLWRQMHQIQTLNFRLFFSELNSFGKNTFKHKKKLVSTAFEMAWVNENFKQ